ncbi:stalk domain-containing protein [Symbiobacterium terraclitae]|uniref:stalk domain-containing protein n=1 Tax=Symbiobacterium terraclitae TaxID=557451 RepID=UPI0035B55853
MRIARVWLLFLALALLMGSTAPVRASAPPISAVWIAGNYYPGGELGEMVGDYAVLHSRRVLEALGFWVNWSPEDGSKTVWGGYLTEPVVFRPGEKQVTVGDQIFALPVAPYVKDGKMYAPLELFRAMGLRVEWVSATREVEITPPPYSQVEPFGPAGTLFTGLGQDEEGRLYLIVGDSSPSAWQSSDRGATWEPLDVKGDGEWLAELVAADQNPAGATYPGAYQVVSSPDDPSWAWALVQGAVMVSQDGGQTWQKAADPWPVNPEKWPDMRLVPGVGREVFLLTGDRGVLYSPTGGGQWFKVTGYWPDAQVRDALVVDGRLFLATTAGGVIIPQRIPQAAKALPRLAPKAIDWGGNLTGAFESAGRIWLDPQREGFVYALLSAEGSQGIYRTADGGATWAPVPGIAVEGWWTGFFHHPTESGHYGYQRMDGIWVTRDDGATWHHIAREATLRTLMGNLMFLPSGRVMGNTDGLGGSHLYYSDDLRTLVSAEGAPPWHITSIVANPAVPGTLYACDWSDGRFCLTSTDDGATWQPLAAQPPAEAGPPFRLSWGASAPDELIAGRFVTRDGGQTWEPLPFFQEGDRVREIVFHPGDPQHRVALLETDQGIQVLVTHDGGQSWASIGHPPGAPNIQSVAIDRAGNLWVSEHAGVWRIPAGSW